MVAKAGREAGEDLGIRCVDLVDGVDKRISWIKGIAGLMEDAGELYVPRKFPGWAG